MQKLLPVSPLKGIQIAFLQVFLPSFVSSYYKKVSIHCGYSCCIPNPNLSPACFHSVKNFLELYSTILAEPFATLQIMINNEECWIPAFRTVQAYFWTKDELVAENMKFMK